MAAIINPTASPTFKATAEKSMLGTKTILPGQGGKKDKAVVEHNAAWTFMGEAVELYRKKLAEETKEASAWNIKMNKIDAERLHETINTEQEEGQAHIDAFNQQKEREKATQDMAFQTAEMTIQASEDVAKAVHANSREQAGLAGAMALVQGAQAVMGVLASYSTLGPIGTVLADIQIADIIAMTAVQEAKIAGAKFAGGTVSVPGTGGGDSVPAMLKPGELVANQGQKDNILAAIMNGSGGTTTNTATHHYTIDSRVTVMGNVDSRAVKDFATTRAQADRNLVLQLRRLNMSGQSQGVYSR
jgi:hypothetical protein